MYHKRKKMKHGGSHDGNAMARRETKMGGGKMREKMGHGGMYGDDMMKRKKKGMGGRAMYKYGGDVSGKGTQPEYASGDMPKAMPN
jgi:hypothetical protein